MKKEEKKPLGLYVHIPFCVRKCAYCDFLSAPASRETMDRYAEMLKQEIRGAEEIQKGYRGATVFFGGGTPSLLQGRQIAEFLEELNRMTPLESGAEITVECNPGTLTEEKLDAYRAAGVNRLSIGLQSADNRELRLLGRIHTWEEFLETFELTRNKGFGNLNIDLMSALPGQTREGWLRTLEKVTELKPEHISAYSLIMEEGTPFYERYREGGPGFQELPDEDTDRRMYEDTKAFLGQKGYERYEISNYARPGFACRHNLAYWERTEYRGFGLGAASLMKQVRYKNGTNLQKYLAGDFSYEERLPLTPNDELEETMFLGLRKMEGVELTERIRNTYGMLLDRYVQEGVLACRDGRIFLTDRGIDVSNYVLAGFLLDEKDG